ncbi:acyl-CoA thioesterase [Epibacterium sp. SM1969]|uniref:Acyl-CoA thioesterase n=1 Tax=Tritonibacter aquimaris TaxID=2663379 RepID=A0A844AK23_9RHOB|nr:thioesterase family protein [Tritonibacter aquimaris]MQY41515.1 acyl-CoA thioesterase [Tritonibacter aquimaris]
MELRFHTPLSAEEQLAHGISEPQAMAMADRVRFAEVDMLRHVNNKAYLEWFETSRVVHFNYLCMPHFKDMPEPRTVLRNANVHYIQEMKLNEPYIATTTIKRFRRTSYVQEQQIWSGGVLRCRMEGVMVLRTPDGSEGYPLPESLKEYWRDGEGAVPEV